MSFITHHFAGLIWYTSTLIAAPHGFSTRPGGVSPPPWDALNLGVGRGDDLANVMENYVRFCGVLGVDSQRAVLAKQIHGTHVRTVTDADAGKGLYRPRDYAADAFVTAERGLPLTVFSADCGILLLYDPVTGDAGAVHAGWRGCAGGIVQKAVERLCALSGADASRLCAVIGPCIGSCCFETDSDVPDAMRGALGADADAYLQWDGRKWHVDLAGLNRQWLLRAGLVPERVDVLRICTACRPDLFWSHRKMGEARGVQVGMITPA